MEAENKFNINVKFSESQKIFLKNIKRFSLWRAGRRSGKTHAMEYYWIKRALTMSKAVNWYVAQDLATTLESNIPIFHKYVPDNLIVDFSKQNKCYTLYNGAKCYFKTANSADNLRGRAVDTLGCEEAAFWRNGRELYHEILRPQLADTLGWAMLCSSPPNKKAPTGSEWFRRLEQTFLEQIKNGSDEYCVFHSTILDNPYIHEKEKENLRNTTDPDAWSTEYMGEYNDKIGIVYWEFDELVAKKQLNENVLMRVRGLDYGVSDNTACSWIALLPNNTIYVYDEYAENNLDIKTNVSSIISKTKIPCAISVLDSSCWGRESDLKSVATRFSEYGIAPVKATKEKDGSISDIKNLFAENRIIIAPYCVKTIRALQDWQHDQHEPDILAALRYAIDILIRSGKLFPPMRNNKQPSNIIERRDEMEKRIASLKRKMNGNNFSFKLFS